MSSCVVTVVVVVAAAWSGLHCNARSCVLALFLVTCSVISSSVLCNVVCVDIIASSVYLRYVFCLHSSIVIFDSGVVNNFYCSRAVNSYE